MFARRIPVCNPACKLHGPVSHRRFATPPQALSGGGRTSGAIHCDCGALRGVCAGGRAGAGYRRGLGPEGREEVRLGQPLVNVPILSGNHSISCATCPHPQFDASDGLSTGRGEGGAGLDPTGGTITPRCSRRSRPTKWRDILRITTFRRRAAPPTIRASCRPITAFTGLESHSLARTRPSGSRPNRTMSGECGSQTAPRMPVPFAGHPCAT